MCGLRSQSGLTLLGTNRIFFILFCIFMPYTCQCASSESAPLFMIDHFCSLDPVETSYLDELTIYKPFEWNARWQFIPYGKVTTLIPPEDHYILNINVGLCPSLGYQASNGVKWQGGIAGYFAIVGTAFPLRKRPALYFECQPAENWHAFLNIHNLGFRNQSTVDTLLVTLGGIRRLQQGDPFSPQQVGVTIKAKPYRSGKIVVGVLGDWNLFFENWTFQIYCQLCPVLKASISLRHGSLKRALVHNQRFGNGLSGFHSPPPEAAKQSAPPPTFIAPTEKIQIFYESTLAFFASQGAGNNPIPHKGKQAVLLVGEPGTGKTCCVQNLMHAVCLAGGRYWVFTPNEFSGLDIVARGAVSAKLEQVKRHKGPGLVIFEELDRAEGQDSALCDLHKLLLAWLNEIPDNTVIVATANDRSKFDQALVRSGRFGKTLYFIPPEKPARQALLALYLKPHGFFPGNFDWALAAENAAGLTGADIKMLADGCEEFKSRYQLSKRNFTMENFIAIGNEIRTSKPGGRPLPTSKQSGLAAIYKNEKLKQAIKKLSLRIHLSESQKRLARQRGLRITFPNILLVGPMAGGKTHIAQAIGDELKIPVTTLNASTAQTKWRGEGTANLTKLIAELKARETPQILFIDEIHGICGKLEDNFLNRDDSLVHVLLRELDPKHDQNPNQQLMILAATNHPELIEEAVIRQGRFERVNIEPISLETEEEIRDFLAFKLEMLGEHKEFDFNHFQIEQAAKDFYEAVQKSETTIQCSPAHFDTVIEAARWNRIYRPEGEADKNVSNEDFKQACEDKL